MSRKLLRLLKDEDVMSTVKKAAADDAIYNILSRKELEIFKDPENKKDL